MNNNQHDVIVIGGGPGGSSTATFLAQKGYRVILFEKDTFPRFHVGESLLPAAWDLWDQLGVTSELEAAGFTVKQGVNFRLFNADSDLVLLTGEYPDYFQRPYTYHVERARFDQIMLDNARRCGAEVRMGWNVNDVLFDGPRALGVSASPEGGEAVTFLAPMIVDASGRDCVMAWKLGRRRPDPALNKISHFTHFKGAYRRPNEDGSTMTEIYTTDDGWIWYIPLSHDIVSVGAVLDAKAAGKTKGPQARFEKAVAASPTIQEWLKPAEQIINMHTISSISYINDCFVGDGFLMVGDASMFVDPIFSAGVTLAIRGGLFAAEAIDQAFQVGDFRGEKLAVYEEHIRHPMNKIFQMIYNWYEVLERKDADNVFYRSRKMPLLRERLIVLLSGGYDRVDMDALLGEAGG